MAVFTRHWILKACSSCGGDIYTDRNNPLEAACLQCGRSAAKRSDKEQASLRKEVGRGRKARLP